MKVLGSLVVLFLLAGCAGMETLIDRPNVSLRDVSVGNVDMKSQTFVMNFDVTNPNPFPLQINGISYGVELDGHRFASGNAQCAIEVPAASDGAFEISVDLNLLKTAPKLLFVVRDGVRRDISYKLVGRFDIDLPMSPRVEFANEGNIRLLAAN